MNSFDSGERVVPAAVLVTSEMLLNIDVGNFLFYK